jgi:transcriptional regulator
MGETKKPLVGELIPGTLDMLILKTLSVAERGDGVPAKRDRGAGAPGVNNVHMHGYSIAQFIQQASRDVLKVEEGALYPALHRLEIRGLLKAEWGASENNRRAKFYKLTALGRRELDEEAAYWARVAAAVTRVMQTT